MRQFTPFSINLGSRLMEVKRPLVMAILNVTPDSFFAGSRNFDDVAIEKRIREIISQGADIVDIGGYSSRPGADDIPADEEYARLRRGLTLLRRICPEMPISVDTFRSEVAERCIGDFGVEIINDISAGSLDERMIATVGRCKAAYILMHMRGTPTTMNTMCSYDDIVADIATYFSQKIDLAVSAGINDIILDPGFGFSKTVEGNYELLGRMDFFKQLGLPVLAGLSRKSMIYKLFGCTPMESLNGTTAVNMIALTEGADILRVHDVREAMECVRIFCKTFAINETL